MLSEPAAIQGSARIEALNPAHEKVGAVLKLKKKVSSTNGGTYFMLLHDKTAGADFLDEVSVKPVSNCQSVVRTSGIHYVYLQHLLISNLFPFLSSN